MDEGFGVLGAVFTGAAALTGGGEDTAGLANALGTDVACAGTATR